MNFKVAEYCEPDFNTELFISAPECKTEEVVKKGVAPRDYHATSIFPEYYKINGKWVLAKESRMDCVAVVKENDEVDIKEFRRLETGDKVVIGRSEDAMEGIFVHTEGFTRKEAAKELFAFRTSTSRETAYSKDYDNLYKLLKYERDNGYIVWVLGPAAVFDANSRDAMAHLIQKGYAHVVFAGNALATHDLEAAVKGTALGQDVYSQEIMPMGHYNHIDVINKAREKGSIRNLVEEGIVKEGVMYSCVKNNVPFVLAGSIRDDGPLPEVISDVYAAQDAMRTHIRKATTVLGLATQLHTIATGNMTPSYQVVKGTVRPVYIYSVDVSEFAVNKLKDRGTLGVNSIVTNIQDFLVNLQRNLD